MFLFQLLCVLGEWDKAGSQLNVVAQLSAEARMLSVAYGQAIEAERFRARVFAGTERPVLLAGGSDWASDLVTALGHFAAGRTEEGEAARTRAFDAAPDTRGKLDGEGFDWISDADSCFGPSFEAIISGQWGLVPFAAIERMTSEGARDLRDIVWYPVQIAFRTGQSFPAMLPARYPGSEGSEDSNIVLGRSTEWQAQSWGETGRGQHLLQLSSGEDRGLLSLRSLTFD